MDSSGGGDKFDASNKLERQKELRSALIQLKKQEDYLLVAENHSYEIAEQMEKVEGGGQLDPNRQKIVTELVKDHNKYSGTRRGDSYNYRKQPYIPRPYYQNPQQHPSYQYQYQQPMFQPVYPQSGQLALMGSGGQSGPVGQVPQGGQGGMFRGRGYGTGRGGRGSKAIIDKSTSTCFECGIVGHWTGDPGCPGNVADTMPPGTG